LDHDGRIKRRIRRQKISDVLAKDLPHHLPLLETLYKVVPELLDRSVHLCLDVKDPNAADSVVALAKYFDVTSTLWLAHSETATVAAWRKLDDAIHLLNSTRLTRITEGLERRAADLAEAKIDGINLQISDWSGGLCTLFHRFGVECFAWDAQQEREIDRLLGFGADAVFSDHVDRLVAVAQKQ